MAMPTFVTAPPDCWSITMAPVPQNTRQKFLSVQLCIYSFLQQRFFITVALTGQTWLNSEDACNALGTSALVIFEAFAFEKYCGCFGEKIQAINAACFGKASDCSSSCESNMVVPVGFGNYH